MKLLEQLTTTAGIPGREHRIRALIRRHIKGLFDEVRTDAMGSLICIRAPRPRKGAQGKTVTKKRASKTRSAASGGTPTRVMVAAHMDQIGFMVKHVDDKGFVRVNPVGGFDTRNLFARLVTVCPDVNDPKKDLPGVMNPAGKPVHIATPEERNKVPEIGEFVVDLGLPGDTVKKKVKIGDMVVLRAPAQKIGKTFVSQCLDNRVACWIAIRAVQKLAKAGKGHDAEIAVVFTVQEEVGLRGARTSAYALEPDIGIGLDTTLCVDTPGVAADLACTTQAGGVAITCMDSASIGDYALIEQFEAIAKKRKIKHQRSVMARGGTDSGTIQAAREGVRTMTLSCPTRYIHTVTEMVHEDELKASVDLLAAFLEEA